jgi:hypothetical protein
MSLASSALSNIDGGACLRTCNGGVSVIKAQRNIFLWVRRRGGVHHGAAARTEKMDGVCTYGFKKGV